MLTFEARIWEKAEHWSFDVKIEAINEDAAWQQVRKDYPHRSYSIRDLREVYSTKEE
jgi:hypothetical protein